jgi:PIN domain
MTKPRVYLETSVISYLSARPSADALNAARQFHSYTLWQATHRFDFFLSETVLNEVRSGDALAAAQRMQWCDKLPILEAGSSAVALAEYLVASQAVPMKAFVDAVHIATASVHGMDLIASWNFKHIAGALPRRRIEDTLRTRGVHVPTIATPEEILESE